MPNQQLRYYNNLLLHPKYSEHAILLLLLGML